MKGKKMVPFSTHRPKLVRQRRSNMSFEIIDAPSPNFDERTRPIRYVVLHYTGMNNEEAALNLLRDNLPKREIYENHVPPHINPDGTIEPVPPNPPQRMNRVSAHYVVFEDGRIFGLVPEDKRAWQAGAGEYGGETNMNSASIGIEICNGGHDFGLPDFADRQIEAVMWLVEGIKARHGLDRQHIIGHADLAPHRKQDPGEKFPWHKFADRGISLKMPKGDSDDDNSIISQIGATDDANIKKAQEDLAAIGYGISANGNFDDHTKLVLQAFQRRFRQNLIDGNVLDADTFGKIKRLRQIVLPS